MVMYGKANLSPSVNKFLCRTCAEAPDAECIVKDRAKCLI